MDELHKIIDEFEERLDARIFEIEKKIRNNAIWNWVTTFTLGAFVLFFILFFISYKYL